MRGLTRNEYLAMALGLGAGFLLFFILVWSWAPAASPPPHESAEQHYESSPYGTSSQQEIAKSWGETWAFIWDRTWDDPVALYTAVLAVLTAVLGFATVASIAVGIVQIRLGRSEFIATHRPRLRARRFYINRLTDDRPVEVEFELANIGDSDAQGLVLHLQVKVPPRRGDVLYDRPEAPFSGMGYEAFSSIRRGASRHFVIPTTLEHREHDPRFKVENMVISGIVRYSDAIGTPRATSFVRRYLQTDAAGPPQVPYRFAAPEKADRDFDYED